MTDFLAEKRTEIRDRLAELKPRVEEAQHLEAAIAALNGIDPSPTAAPIVAAAPRRGRGRPRRAQPRAAAKPAVESAKPTPKRRAGRRKGSGKRGAEAFAIIQEQPGITIPQLAVRLGIKQNYLYRVLPELEKGGSVRKDGRGWYPTKVAA